METSATSAPTSSLLPGSDSDLDLSTESLNLPPSPKQPRIEPEESTVVTGVNVDVAVLAKKRNALIDSEKYNFYCNHFTPTVNYKFPCEGGRSFLYRYLTRYNWLVYSRKERMVGTVSLAYFLLGV